MKAIIYARQSSGNDDVSESVEAQIENCRKLAEKEGLEIVGVFRDLNTSGETYPEGAEEIARVDAVYNAWAKSQSTRKICRSGLGGALRLLDGVNVLLVNELTRLYRPVNGSFLEGHINALLREHNVKVLQVQGGCIDLTKFDQQLITSIKNQILYDDVQKKRQNSLNAFRIKRDSGKLCCGTHVFGLEYLGNDQIGVRPECVEIVRFIFDSVCAFRPYNWIVRECNARWGGTRFFYPSLIYSIAKQPLYSGFQYNSEGVLIRNVQMAGKEFISPEQWETAGKVLSTKRRGYCGRSKKNWLPLSGRLLCGACGGKLVCRVDHGRICYVCGRRNFDSGHLKCGESRIRFEAGIRGEPALLNAVYPLLSVGLLEEQSKAGERLRRMRGMQQMEGRLETMLRKERELFDLFLEGLVTKEEMRNMLAGGKEKKAELIREMELSRISETSSGNGKGPDLQEKVLARTFTRLAAGNLPAAVYERLLNEAEITAAVYRDRVEFRTIFGNVPVPRIRRGNGLWMPEWRIRLSTGGSREDRRITEETRVRIVYLTGRREVLADLGRISVLSR